MKDERLKELEQLLRAEELGDRLRACVVAAELGESALPVVEELLVELAMMPRQRAWAIRTLQSIQVDEAAGALVLEILADPSNAAEARLAAIQVVKGWSDPELVPLLEQCLDDNRKLEGAWWPPATVSEAAREAICTLQARLSD